MTKKHQISQAGFSLVELMVVVAIIGILAAMAVGQIQKQIAKSRQSEAKVNLASLYSVEKAFWSEFSTYCTDFRVLGYSIEGQMRYAVGFELDHLDYATAVAAGYTPAAGGGSAVFAATVATCGAFPLIGCNVVESNGAPPQPIAGTSATGSAYMASANADIYQNGMSDIWTINEGKTLDNFNPGIP